MCLATPLFLQRYMMDFKVLDAQVSVSSAGKRGTLTIRLIETDQQLALFPASRMSDEAYANPMTLL